MNIKIKKTKIKTMIGKYNLQNIKNLSSLKPSIVFFEEKTNNQTFLEACIYIQLDEKKTPDGLRFDVLGYIGASNSVNSKIDNESKSPFKINGTSGAYPGLGSLLYECFMCELKDRYGEDGFLMCDRSSITEEAESIYLKMNASSDFEKIVVKPSELSFTEDIEFDYDDCFVNFNDYLNALERGEPSATPSHINTAFRVLHSKELKSIMKLLKKNHKESVLSNKDLGLLKDYGQTLGETIMDDPEPFRLEVVSGFPDFKKCRVTKSLLEKRI